MIRRFLRSRVAAAERRLGGPLDYARRILDLSLGAFWRFGMFAPLSEYRRTLPKDARAIARLVVVLREDCGDCARIELNLAKHKGIPDPVLRAVLDRRPELLPPVLADVYRFAQALCSGEPETEIRQRLERVYSPEQMMELALAIGTAPVYPRVRRAMGLATSCSAVRL